jgi:hypothetical protein
MTSMGKTISLASSKSCPRKLYQHLQELLLNECKSFSPGLRRPTLATGLMKVLRRERVRESERERERERESERERERSRSRARERVRFLIG